MRRIYALFDRKLLQFGELVLAQNDYVVERQLLDAVQASPDSLMAKHTQDFDLYVLGSFEETLGVLEVEPKRIVINLDELVSANRSPHLLSKEG